MYTFYEKIIFDMISLFVASKPSLKIQEKFVALTEKLSVYFAVCINIERYIFNRRVTQ